MKKVKVIERKIFRFSGRIEMHMYLAYTNKIEKSKKKFPIL